MYFYDILFATMKCTTVTSAIHQRFGLTALPYRINQPKQIMGAYFEEE